MKNYIGSHWQQRSNLKPKLAGYNARTAPTVGGATPLAPPPPPPPVAGAASMDDTVSPYFIPGKAKMMAKHKSRKK